MTAKFSNLRELAEHVSSRAELASFVRELLNDYRLNREGWENDSLDHYLEAIAAWVEDMGGFYKNQGLPTPEKAEWSIFSQILLAAKYYE